MFPSHDPFMPRSPYGAAKLYAYQIVKNYREAYDMFACNGILFNHESPRRGETFITKKVTMFVAHHMLHDKNAVLKVGNLDAKRDWGHAKDYVYGMWKMLQHDTPEDFVLATGKSYTIRQLIDTAYTICGQQIEWDNSGTYEVGYINNRS